MATGGGGGMRLRVRAAGGGGAAPTFRVQVPPPATLYDLRNALSQIIGAPADSIRLSLNKRDEIGGDAAAPLAAFGVRSGDLIFFFDRDLGLDDTLIREARTSDAAVQSTVSAAGSSAAGMQAVGHDHEVSEEFRVRRELCAAAADKRAHRAEEKKGIQSRPESSSSSTHGGADHGKEDKEVYLSEESEKHDASDGALPADPEKFRCLIPNLLLRLLSTEGRNLSEPHGFLVLAVHAVMLETGFLVVGCPENRVPWASLGLPMVLKYTLPELLGDYSNVILRCQSVGNFVIVYGAVAGSAQVYRLALSISNYLADVQGDVEAMQVDGQEGRGNALSVYRDAFALWKEVKDSLTLPLLMLLCERAGLPLPACFQLLPTELKMKILEWLPPKGLATVACVSSEMKFLASNEGLWKAKYIDEFKWKEGDKAPTTSWKHAFVQEWYRRKRREVPGRVEAFPVPFRRPPHGRPPFGPPGIIGGDYDIYPFGGPSAPFGGGIGPFGGPRFRRALNPGNNGPLASSIGSGLLVSRPEESIAPGLLLSRPGENSHMNNIRLDGEPEVPRDFI